VARTVDVQPVHLTDVVRRAALHKGAAFTEIYQNCNVFNDNAFTFMTEKAVRADAELEVEHGKPLLFGKGKDKGIRLNSKLYPEVFHVGKDGDASQAIVHDEQNNTLSWLLAGMGPPHFPTPIGVLRAVSQPTYEVMMTDQENEITKKKGHGDLEKLLNSGETWTVS
jgi:2-oxoglutarate ferredoxin oxidoreductase subunit beta